ncbi:OB-fold nucleic acid binding domain-containing protein [Nanoarchaeota archaeon]
MKISEIQGNQGKIDVEGDVVEISEPREFEKYGKTLRVATAILKDDSGTVKLTLWNEEIGKIKKGDRVAVKNGYARTFRDEVQLTAGKFGKMEVVGEAKEAPKAESKPEEDLFKEEDEW